MARISDKEKKIAYTKFKKYMKLYGDKYTPNVRDFIKKNFLSDYFENFVENDIMDQVYSAVGVYDNTPNIYDTFIEEMQRNFDIDRRLVEVASGWYPALAEKVSVRQKCGSITIYEPSLLMDTHDKFKIIKEPLEESTIVTDADMIYALRPCNAIENIIKVANHNDLDLFVGLCGCTHFGVFDDFFEVLDEDLKKWYKYLEELVQVTLPANRKYEFYTIKGLRRPIIKTIRK